MAYFEELTSWTLAKKLTVRVYELMQDSSDFGFKDQIQRAAVSIMNNIAEGSESGSTQLFIKYLHTAKGSCAEVRSMVYLCKELRYCSEEMSQDMISQCKIISSAINSHIKYLETLKQQKENL